MSQTKIEWCDTVWNPTTGCSPISAGCERCYAARFAKRLVGRYGYPKDEPFRVTLHPERLEEPLKWKKPRRVFVNSMGDLFHEDVPGRFINEIWMVMRNAIQHTYLILTKRPEQMLAWTRAAARAKGWPINEIWPDNVWLGITAENQQAADDRIPILLEIPAAVRFVSCEPLLGPINLSNIRDGKGRLDALRGVIVYPTGDPQYTEQGYPCRKLDWVICGGETGPNARPMHPDWVRNLRDQCRDAGIPFFFKGWGEWHEACPPDDEIWNGHPPTLRHEHGAYFIRLGKKNAGCILDGEVWNKLLQQKGEINNA